MTRIERTRLYRSNDGMTGVLGGVAEYMGIEPTIIRVAFFFACVFGFVVPLVPIYIIMVFVLKRRPENLYRDEKDEEFWREVRNRPHVTTSDMRRRFRDIDRRIQKMEAFVTSKRFRLEREFENLDR